jgi:hypothetical protein
MMQQLTIVTLSHNLHSNDASWRGQNGSQAIVEFQVIGSPIKELISGFQHFEAPG